RHAGGPDALWAHGISGDLPLVLVQIDDPDDVDIVRQLLRAHEYWRMKRLAVDLVILNERAPSYVQDLQSWLETLLRTSQSVGPQEGYEPLGNVYIVRADRVTAAQRDVLMSAARAVLSSRRGTLAEQITRAQRPDAAPIAPVRRLNAAKPTPAVAESPRTLEFFNGLGGFEDVAHGVALDLLQLVPLDDSIKISRLTLTNVSGRARRLSVTAYVEWVLGAARSAAAPFVVTEIDATTGAMFARNAWRHEFAARVAFVDLAGTHTAWTADCTEFLARHGMPDHPAAVERKTPLSGRVGAGFDPCGALQTIVELPAGGRREIVFFLGEAASA